MYASVVVWWKRSSPVDYLGSVRRFHRAFGVPAPDVSTGHVDEDVRRSREALMTEELEELIEAMHSEDVVAIADGLADLLYVVFGTAVAYGIPMDQVFAEVHRSNMTKLGPDGQPIIGEAGKRLKGPGYVPPNIEPLVGRT
jgi:predicted HAD superfamily Cof-like phosphohydrolase